MKARTTVSAVVLAAALGVSGCGAQPTLTAADEVPALSAALTKVDGYLAHHQSVAARRTLLALISDTRSAQRNGTLSKASAERIIAAARRLLALLPQPTPTTTPTPIQQPVQKPQPKEPKKHDEKKKPEDKKKDPRHQEGDQRLSTPAPTVSSSPTPTPEPSPVPSDTATPAAMTTPTP